MNPELDIDHVRRLIGEAYIPFANEERAIPWPEQDDRLENDAEHSYSLALIGMALGERLGMDPAKIAYYATIHDLPELFAGDTSVWDEEGRKTKHQRELEATERIGIVFSDTPILKLAIHQYEAQEDEESRFVYALDKLLAVIMIVETEGYFWKQNGISFDQHIEKVKEMLNKVSAHPVVYQWYRELEEYITENRSRFFNS